MVWLSATSSLRAARRGGQHWIYALLHALVPWPRCRHVRRFSCHHGVFPVVHVANGMAMLRCMFVSSRLGDESERALQGLAGHIRRGGGSPTQVAAEGTGEPSLTGCRPPVRGFRYAHRRFARLTLDNEAGQGLILLPVMTRRETWTRQQRHRQTRTDLIGLAVGSLPKAALASPAGPWLVPELHGTVYA